MEPTVIRVDKDDNTYMVLGNSIDGCFRTFIKWVQAKQFYSVGMLQRTTKSLMKGGLSQDEFVSVGRYGDYFKDVFAEAENQPPTYSKAMAKVSKVAELSDFVIDTWCSTKVGDDATTPKYLYLVSNVDGQRWVFELKKHYAESVSEGRIKAINCVKVRSIETLTIGKKDFSFTATVNDLLHKISESTGSHIIRQYKARYLDSDTKVARWLNRIRGNEALTKNEEGFATGTIALIDNDAIATSGLSNDRVILDNAEVVDEELDMRVDGNRYTDVRFSGSVADGVNFIVSVDLRTYLVTLIILSSAADLALCEPELTIASFEKILYDAFER